MRIVTSECTTNITDRQLSAMTFGQQHCYRQQQMHNGVSISSTIVCIVIVVFRQFCFACPLSERIIYIKTFSFNIYNIMWLVYLSLLTTTVLVSAQSDDDPLTIVKTNLGLVHGRRVVTDRNTTAYVFLGVPYAEPPIGQLRYRLPMQKKPWSDTINAQQYKVRDVCLSLMIYNHLVFMSLEYECHVESRRISNDERRLSTREYIHKCKLFTRKELLGHVLCTWWWIQFRFANAISDQLCCR